MSHPVCKVKRFKFTLIHPDWFIKEIPSLITIYICMQIKSIIVQFNQLEKSLSQLLFLGLGGEDCQSHGAL